MIKKQSPELIRKFRDFVPGEIGISSITMAELYYGANKSQHQDRNLMALESFLLPLEILAFDDRAAITYGELCALTEKNGTPIGALDLMIAAQVKSLGLTLVTNNTKKFSRIPALGVENWAKA